MFSSVKNFIYSTPTPSSISFHWNYGSLLGVCLLIQIVTGVFLSFHYSSTLPISFDSVVKICEEVAGGWTVRSAHANGASFFFILIYLHIARGLLFGSFVSHKMTWLLGVAILFLLMATAFLGYVLPWGQMSFWGATVITNLISAFPMGEKVVRWVWGGFSVAQPTLDRFFSLHLLLPMIVSVLVIGHILLLHSTGSSNPLGVDFHSDKSFFHPFFVSKDILGLLVFTILFFSVSILFGDLFMDPDNFMLANPLSTPPHIQPEWYFLFAYAILRSVPNKLGGVIALVMSIAILAVLPVSSGKPGVFSVWKKMTVMWVFVSFSILTWVGSMPVEIPFVQVGQFFSILYFSLLISTVVM